MRAMARADDGAAALIEVKAVETSWPTVGAAEFSPRLSPQTALALEDGAYGAAVEDALLDRLNLKVGDRFALGAVRLEIRATLVAEPDRLGAGIGLGPRALISQEALRATGLVQPGSLVRWTTRVLMGAGGRAADRGRRAGLHRRRRTRRFRKPAGRRAVAPMFRRASRRTSTVSPSFSR